MDARVFDIPRHLALLPLFNALEPEELREVAADTALRRLARGEMLFHVGDPCNEFHVVVSGQVKLFMSSPAGQEKVLDLIDAGQSFGEAIMFGDRCYFLNAQALAETLLLTVGKRAVLAGIEGDPRFALRMLTGLSRRMHGLVHDVAAHALHSGMQRVIGYLLRDQVVEDCATGEVVTVSLPVSKATIASRLSLTPEYFSRVLHELEAAGLVRIDKRDVHILDPKRLADYPGR